MKRKLEYIEDKRASKMARIEEVKAGNDISGVLVKKVQEEIEDAKKYNSSDDVKIVFAEYTLNDLNALETKFSMCNAEPIKVSKEAKDGSSIHPFLRP